VATPSLITGPVTEAWTARYNGRGGGADWAFDVAVDDAGSVYVTGKSFYRRPYDYSYATVKYDADGNELWVARYDGPGGDDDVAHAIAVDGSGNAYVTGKSYNSLHEDYAYATVKYDPDGNQTWEARYDGAGEGDDIARDITVDDAGNVYVTGSSGGDLATVKYDSAGEEQWAARYEGSSGGEDGAIAVAVDGYGNVYVAGTANEDYVTIKYGPDGHELWAVNYDGFGRDEEARDMVLDASGNVYVTGRSFSTEDLEYHYATVKYDPDGNELWAVPCYGATCRWGGAAAVAVDERGNVCVTGRGYNGLASRYCTSTINYDADGSPRWVEPYNGSAEGKGGPLAVAVDGSGNVYVAGETYTGKDFDDYNFVTVKYDAGGNELWLAQYDAPGEGWDRAVAVVVDAAGNAYVTGRSDGGVSNADYLTIKYVPRDTEP
jgi:hypothetical protein